MVQFTEISLITSCTVPANELNNLDCVDINLNNTVLKEDSADNSKMNQVKSMCKLRRISTWI